VTVHWTGLHHLRLPVADLDAAREFWVDVFGYRHDFDFPGDDGPAAIALRHPGGAPNLVLWNDPGRAAASAGFVWFGIGLPSAAAVEDLARRLDAAGIRHDPIEGAFVDIKLPRVETPDGQFVSFYVKPDPAAVAPARA